MGKRFAGDVFKIYSAHKEIKDYINWNALRLMKHLDGIDMEAWKHSKLILDIPKPDIVITMGCNVSLASYCFKRYRELGLHDPTGKNDNEFIKVTEDIAYKIHVLKEALKNHKKDGL